LDLTQMSSMRLKTQGLKARDTPDASQLTELKGLKVRKDL